VKYGLLYAHARASKLCDDRTDPNPLLTAKAVHLLVLAPGGYYRYNEPGGLRTQFEFRWLEQSLNEELCSLNVPVTIEFRFQQFTPEFDTLYGQPTPMVESVRAFQRNGLRAREPLYR